MNIYHTSSVKEDGEMIKTIFLILLLVPLHWCGNDQKSFKPILSVIDLTPLIQAMTDVDTDIDTFVEKLRSPPVRDRNKFSHTRNNTDIIGIACRTASEPSRDAFIEVNLILCCNNTLCK